MELSDTKENEINLQVDVENGVTTTQQEISIEYEEERDIDHSIVYDRRSRCRWYMIYVLLIIDAVLIGRFVCLPLVLWQTLEGPVLITTLPFAALLFLDSMFKLILIITRSTLGQPSIFQTHEWFNLKYTNQGEDNENYTMFENKSTVIQKVLISRKIAAICYLCWFPISIFMTFVIFAISLFGVFILYTEPDGYVVAGREDQYDLAIASSLFSGLSFIVQSLIATFLSILLCCNQKCCCCKCSCCCCESFACLSSHGTTTTSSSNSDTTGTSATEQIMELTVENSTSSESAIGTNVTDIDIGPQSDTGDESVTDEQKEWEKNLRMNQVRAVAGGLWTLYGIFAFVLLVTCMHLTFYAWFYHTDQQASYADCDPILIGTCALPFPSSHWLVNDTSTPSGYRVQVGDHTLPFTRRQVFMSPALLNTHDGFSLHSPLLWHLEGEDVPDSQLVNFQNIDKSLLLNSSTLLLHLDSAKLHPHFSEVDYLRGIDAQGPYTGYSSRGVPRYPAYMMPAKALYPNATYIAVVKGLRDTSGVLLSATALTKDYVAAYGGDSAALVRVKAEEDGGERYARFASPGGAFASLQSLGVNLANIQLLWDFRTTSTQSVQLQVTSVRDLALQRVQEALNTENPNGVGLYRRTWLDKTDDCSNTGSGSGDDMAARAYYRVNVPWFLRSEDRGLGKNGDEFIKEFLEPGFNISEIPIGGNIGLSIGVSCAFVRSKSDLNSNKGIIEYGHGLFEDRSAPLEWTWFREVNNWQYGISWAMEWRGFSRYDILEALHTMAYNTDYVESIEAGMLQTIANKVAAKEILKYILEEDASSLSLSGLAPPPASLRSSYYGVSMGAILGGGYIPLMQIPRSVNIIGGSVFSFILGRSHLFTFYGPVMDLQFYNRMDCRIALSIWQAFIEPFESGAWSNRTISSTTSPTEGLQMLLQIVNGDTTVSTIAGHMQARNFGMANMAPALFSVSGLENEIAPYLAISGNTERSLFNTEYTEEANAVPANSQIPEPSRAHFCLPQDDNIQAQGAYFLYNQMVTNPCGNTANGCIVAAKADCDLPVG